jgi:hypothetical protein
MATRRPVVPGGTLVQHFGRIDPRLDDRLGVEKFGALVRRPEGFGGLGRLRVLMDECG